MLAFERGVNLFDAPEIADSLFVGRGAEIQDMERILLPGSDSSLRKILVLGGMGGIGKTQLSIAYTKKHRNDYTSVFWLNATSEFTLRSSLRQLARRALAVEDIDKVSDEIIWVRVSNWLCELNNSRWLLVYDNYDEPDAYDITKFYPPVVHGSIIVTTRLPSKVNGSAVLVRSLKEEKDSLQILSSRSERDGVEKGKLSISEK